MAWGTGFQCQCIGSDGDSLSYSWEVARYTAAETEHKVESTKRGWAVEVEVTVSDGRL